MTDKQFRALLDILMASDPWPASNEAQDELIALATEEADKRSYEDWIVAYHRFEVAA